MNQPASNCPKCHGEMELGYSIDRSSNATFVGQWGRGTPEKHWWYSLQVNNVVQTPKSNQIIPIGTYRCKSCGFLEFYAREEFAVK